MAEKSTFIKLDRNIQDWRWYDNANTFRVFLHILLNANVKKTGFDGIDVKRGQFVTSYSSISASLKLSVKNVRTAIEHLKSTGEVAVSIYPHFSVITVLNYNTYQDRPAGTSAGNRQAGGNLPAGNRQQYKNSKNERMEEVSTPTLFEVVSYISENRLNVDAEKFFKYYEDSGWKTNKGNPVTNWKSKVLDWHKLEYGKTKSGSVWSGMKKLGED